MSDSLREVTPPHDEPGRPTLVTVAIVLGTGMTPSVYQHSVSGSRELTMGSAISDENPVSQC